MGNGVQKSIKDLPTSTKVHIKKFENLYFIFMKVFMLQVSIKMFFEAHRASAVHMSVQKKCQSVDR